MTPIALAITSVLIGATPVILLIVGMMLSKACEC